MRSRECVSGWPGEFPYPWEVPIPYIHPGSCSQNGEKEVCSVSSSSVGGLGESL